MDAAKENKHVNVPAQSCSTAKKARQKTAGGRMLKELRGLMPWGWDSRLDSNPVGRRGMSDFAEAVKVCDPLAAKHNSKDNKRSQEQVASTVQPSAKKKQLRSPAPNWTTSTAAQGQPSPEGKHYHVPDSMEVNLSSSAACAPGFPAASKCTPSTTQARPAAGERAPYTIDRIPAALGVQRIQQTPHAATPSLVDMARPMVTPREVQSAAPVLSNSSHSAISNCENSQCAFSPRPLHTLATLHQAPVSSVSGLCAKSGAHIVADSIQPQGTPAGCTGPSSQLAAKQLARSAPTGAERLSHSADQCPTPAITNAGAKTILHEQIAGAGQATVRTAGRQLPQRRKEAQQDRQPEATAEGRELLAAGSPGMHRGSSAPPDAYSPCGTPCIPKTLVSLVNNNSAGLSLLAARDAVEEANAVAVDATGAIADAQGHKGKGRAAGGTSDMEEDMEQSLGSQQALEALLQLHNAVFMQPIQPPLPLSTAQQDPGPQQHAPAAQAAAKTEPKLSAQPAYPVAHAPAAQVPLQPEFAVPAPSPDTAAMLPAAQHQPSVKRAGLPAVAAASVFAAAQPLKVHEGTVCGGGTQPHAVQQQRPVHAVRSGQHAASSGMLSGVPTVGGLHSLFDHQQQAQQAKGPEPALYTRAQAFLLEGSWSLPSSLALPLTGGAMPGMPRHVAEAIGHLPTSCPPLFKKPAVAQPLPFQDLARASSAATGAVSSVPSLFRKGFPVSVPLSSRCEGRGAAAAAPGVGAHAVEGAEAVEGASAGRLHRQHGGQKASAQAGAQAGALSPRRKAGRQQAAAALHVQAFTDRNTRSSRTETAMAGAHAVVSIPGDDAMAGQGIHKVEGRTSHAGVHERQGIRHSGTAEEANDGGAVQQVPASFTAVFVKGCSLLRAHDIRMGWTFDVVLDTFP